MILRFILITLFFTLTLPAPLWAGNIDDIRQNLTPKLEKQLKRVGLQLGSPIFIRVFKQEKIVELWVQKPGKKKYDIFKKYPICVFSGILGPKLREGDQQAPEGFYDVNMGRLHPESQFHLAFNLGYPNAFDRARDRTGDYLMIHGSCESKGCYAMTDEGMEELYVIAEAALMNGQPKIDIHIFPFYMTKKNFRFHAKSTWLPFWYSLKPAYDMFQSKRIPPEIDVVGGQYKVKMFYNE